MQELSRHEIDPPTAEDLRQLPLQLEDSETEHCPGLEIDQQIDVTLWAEIVPHCRAEERELADSPTSAELRQAVGIDVRW